MTVKVIKQGKKPEEVVYKSTCKICGTELEAARIDLCFWGGISNQEVHLFAACPTCGKNTDFTRKDGQ